MAGQRSEAAARTSWPTFALPSAEAAATTIAGNSGRPSPRARVAAAKAENVMRAEMPRGARREGVDGSLSRMSSLPNASRAAARAGRLVSDEGRPDAPALTRAQRPTVVRRPVAAPASAQRWRSDLVVDKLAVVLVKESGAPCPAAQPRRNGMSAPMYRSNASTCGRWPTPGISTSSARPCRPYGAAGSGFRTRRTERVADSRTPSAPDRRRAAVRSYEGESDDHPGRRIGRSAECRRKSRKPRPRLPAAF